MSVTTLTLEEIFMKKVILFAAMLMLAPLVSNAAPQGACDDDAIDWAVKQANNPLCTKETAVIERSIQLAPNEFQIIVALCPNQTLRTGVPMKARDNGAGGYTCTYSGE